MRTKFYLTKYHKLNDLLSSKITHINAKKETITSHGPREASERILYIDFAPEKYWLIDNNFGVIGTSVTNTQIFFIKKYVTA